MWPDEKGPYLEATYSLISGAKSLPYKETAAEIPSLPLQCVQKDSVLYTSVHMCVRARL